MTTCSPVTVVVVHRNRPDRLLGTVAAFAAQTVPTTVVVVDSGSEPGALAAVRAGLGPEVRVMALEGNHGFGPSVNAGWRAWLDAGAGEWVAAAPHDAAPAPDAVERIVAAMAARRWAGLASADYGDGASPVIDGYFGGILGPAAIGEGWEDVDHPHGTLLVARRACLDDVGLFDERYFAYGEEADLALRARARGWRIGLVRGARVANPDLSSAVAVVDYLQLRNTLLMVRVHFGRYRAAIRCVVAIIDLVRGLVAPSTRGPYWSVRGRVLALWDHLAARYGPPRPSLTPGARRPVSASRTAGRTRTR